MAMARFRGDDSNQAAVYASLAGFQQAQIGNAPGNFIPGAPNMIASAGIRRIQLNGFNLTDSKSDQITYAYGSLLKTDALFAQCFPVQVAPAAVCQTGVMDRVLNPGRAVRVAIDGCRTILTPYRRSMIEVHRNCLGWRRYDWLRREIGKTREAAFA